MCWLCRQSRRLPKDVIMVMRSHNLSEYFWLLFDLIVFDGLRDYIELMFKLF
jgi:hypothetical protein